MSEKPGSQETPSAFPNEDEKKRLRWREASRRHYEKKKTRGTAQDSQGNSQSNENQNENEDMRNSHQNPMPIEAPNPHLNSHQNSLINEPQPQQLGIYLDPQALMNIAAMMTPNQRKLFESQVNLSVQQMRQSSPIIGSPYPLSSGEGELEREMAKELRYSRWERLKRGNDGSADRRTDFLEKLVLESMKTKQEANPLAPLQSFAQLFTGMQSSNLDMYDRLSAKLASVQNQNMPPSVAVELKRIDVELEKWRMEQQVAMEKWNSLGQMLSPFAPTISQVAGHLLGEKSDVIAPSTNIACPSCGHTYTVSTKPKTPIVCPECKNPIPMEIFAESEAPTFICPKCGLQMSVPPGAPEQVTLKCPKCGELTPTRQQAPATSESPQAPLPPSPAEEKPSSLRLKARYW